MLLDQGEDLGLLLCLGVLVDGEVVEVNAIGLGQGFKVWVVGDDDGDVDAELASLLPEQQVVQTVTDLGHHDQNLGLGSHRPELVVHLQSIGQAGEVRNQKVGASLWGGTKVDAHEEFFRRAVGELLQVEDVEVMLGKDARHGVDDAWLVRTGECQVVVVGHFDVQ